MTRMMLGASFVLYHEISTKNLSLPLTPHANTNVDDDLDGDDVDSHVDYGDDNIIYITRKENIPLPLL